MAYQSVFKRYELKYLLTKEQKEVVLHAIQPYMRLDKYGRTVIRNIYFDTEDYRLIRHSIERPLFKEKLRIRSYGRAAPDSEVFVEIKRKYNKVVYKRRVCTTETQALDWLCNRQYIGQPSQMSGEINYFLDFYGGLKPKVFLSYEREAFYAVDGSDFRITFDENILCRQEALSLSTEAYGVPLLEDGMTLMEIKCSGGIPIWLIRVLSREHIYKTSFSKYGTAYEKTIFPQKIHLTGEKQYATNII